LNELVAVPFPAGAGNEPVDLTINAGVNAWGFETFYPGGLASVVSRQYGATTGQFDTLARMFSTYRIKSVHIRFTPTALEAAGAQTPMASVVDVASSGSDFAEALTNYSKSRTLRLTRSAFTCCERSINFRNWLV
jgi:hypothetical protein